MTYLNTIENFIESWDESAHDLSFGTRPNYHRCTIVVTDHTNQSVQMLLMNLRACVHNFIVNMLIMETLIVLTAVVVADALPVCSAYCNSLFPRPFDCDCRLLKEENLLPHNSRYHAIENYGNVIKEKFTRGEPEKTFGDKDFQIYTTILSECIIHFILSDRKCNYTGFKANPQTDGVNNYHGNYKLLSDSELILASNNSRKTNKDAMFAAIIDKIRLKKDNFARVTFNVNSGSVNLIENIKDYTFLKDERTSSTQLPMTPMSTLMDVTSPEDLTNSRIIQSTIEYTNTVTLSDEINNITTQSKEHVVRITPNVPEKCNSTKNITSTMDSNKTLVNSSLNPLLNFIATTIDYKYKMDDNNSSDVYGKFSAQNITNETKYINDLDRIHNQSFVDLPKNNNNMATGFTKQYYNTSFTRNNLITETLAEEMHEIAVLARSAINPIHDENIYRPLAISPESSNLKIHENKKTSFRRNKNREHYNESDVPIVRIISREYPNDTVSSIINGTEILPNDHFMEEINVGNSNNNNDFKTSKSKFSKINHIIISKVIPIKSQFNNKHSTEKHIEEKPKDYNVNDGKLYQSGKPNLPTIFLLKPDGSFRIVLDICNKKNQLKQNPITLP